MSKKLAWLFYSFSSAFLILSGSLGSSSVAGEIKSEEYVIEKVQKSYNSALDFSTDFRQETEFRTVNRILKSWGKLYFKRPGKIVQRTRHHAGRLRSRSATRCDRAPKTPAARRGAPCGSESACGTHEGGGASLSVFRKVRARRVSGPSGSFDRDDSNSEFHFNRSLNRVLEPTPQAPPTAPIRCCESREALPPARST